MVIPIVFASEWYDNSLIDTFNDTSDVNFSITNAYVDFHNKSAYMSPTMDLTDYFDNGAEKTDLWTQRKLDGGSWQHDSTSAYETSENSTLQMLNAYNIWLDHSFGSSKNIIFDYFWTTNQSDNTAISGVGIVATGPGDPMFGRRTSTSETNWVYYDSGGAGWIDTGVTMPTGVSTNMNRIDCTGACKWYVNSALVATSTDSSTQYFAPFGGNGAEIQTEYFDNVNCFELTDVRDATKTKVYSTNVTAPISFNRATCDITKLNTSSGAECWLSNDKGVTWENATNKTATFAASTTDL